MKKYFDIIFWITLLLSYNSMFAQNGYRLEFEDVVTLSVDTVPNTAIPANATWSESYTVPANMVLKVNAGIFRNYLSSNSLVAYVYLDIDGNPIGSNSYGFFSNTTLDNRLVPYLKFDNDNPLWVSSGKTIKLTFKSIQNASVTSYFSGTGWVSGVLFRKVPN